MTSGRPPYFHLSSIITTEIPQHCKHPIKQLRQIWKKATDSSLRKDDDQPIFGIFVAFVRICCLQHMDLLVFVAFVIICCICFVSKRPSSANDCGLLFAFCWIFCSNLAIQSIGEPEFMICIGFFRNLNPYTIVTFQLTSSFD